MQLLAKPRGIQRLRLCAHHTSGYCVHYVQFGVDTTWSAKPVGVFIPTQPLRASSLDHGYGLHPAECSQPDTGWYSVAALLLALLSRLLCG